MSLATQLLSPPQRPGPGVRRTATRTRTAVPAAIGWRGMIVSSWRDGRLKVDPPVERRTERTGSRKSRSKELSVSVVRSRQGGPALEPTVGEAVGVVDVVGADVDAAVAVEGEVGVADARRAPATGVASLPDAAAPLTTQGESGQQDGTTR